MTFNLSYMGFAVDEVGNVVTDTAGLLITVLSW